MQFWNISDTYFTWGVLKFRSNFSKEVQSLNIADISSTLLVLNEDKSILFNLMHELKRCDIFVTLSVLKSLISNENKDLHSLNIFDISFTLFGLYIFKTKLFISELANI